MPYKRKAPQTIMRKRRSTQKKTASMVSFKKKVMKVLSSKVEKKLYVFNTASNIYPSNGSTWTTSVIPISPYTSFVDIQQGTTQSSRIGNKISIKRAYMDFIIYPNAQNATSNINPRPSYVQFIFGHQKANPDTLVTTVSDLFQANGSVSGYGNSLNDLFKTVNHDGWVINKRMIFKVGFALNNGTGSLPGEQNNSNNDFHYGTKRRIDITKMVPKTINYSDTSTVPTSTITQLMVTAVAADNTSYGTGEIPCAYAYQLYYEYTDM